MAPDFDKPDCVLMTAYRTRDMLSFLSAFFPFGVTSATGIIVNGLGWTLLVWLGFAIFFFAGWEARVLCSHCPFWAEEGKVLRCHANSGVPKLWRYRPGPMSRSEQAQFLLGAGMLVFAPLVVLIIAGAWIWLIPAAVSGAAFGLHLQLHGCTRCVNFSCPVNRVPKAVRDAYLRGHPVMRQAWEAAGYVLEEGC